ncbi:hypothetical protein [Lacisediminihabitans sp.]|jgi:hypothetical protein|uniref:hypothetical protein n=1 Tax=Lacisediminihabitans sp. TaxID=2787631 RepID=UPI002F93D394
MAMYSLVSEYGERMRETWTKVTPRRASSNRGYFVEILGMEGLSYAEGDFVIFPPSEPLASGGFGLHLGWMDGDVDRKREIVDRLRSGVDVLGSWLVVDDDTNNEPWDGAATRERLVEVVEEVIQILEPSEHLSERTKWLKLRLPALKTSRVSPEIEAIKVQLHSIITGMGGLADLRLESSTRTQEEARSARSRLDQLDDELWSLTRPPTT